MDFIFDNIDRLNEEKKKNVFLNRFSYGDEEDPNVYMLREERDNGAEKRTVIYAPNYVLEKYSNRGGYPLENGGVAYWSPGIMRALSMNNTTSSLNNIVDSFNNNVKKQNQLYHTGNDYGQNVARTFEKEREANNKMKRDKLHAAKQNQFFKPIAEGYEKFMDKKEIREFLFPFKSKQHVIAALDIGAGVNSKGIRMASNADRIASMNKVLYGTKEKEDDRGSEKGAFRHALWQAMITSRYGLDIAYDAASAHETRPYSDTSIRVFDTIDEADIVVDLLNNKIGRGIGNKYPGATNKELSMHLLREFYDNGLYTAEKGNDGFWYVSKRKLSHSKMNDLETDYKNMDEFGFKEGDTVPKIGEYMESKWHDLF